MPEKSPGMISKKIDRILCIWRGHIEEYHRNSEKLEFQYGPRAAGPRSVLNPNLDIQKLLHHHIGKSYIQRFNTAIWLFQRGH